MKSIHHLWLPQDIVGGNHALDLINTVSGWGAKQMQDWIPDASTFLAWSQMAGVLSKRENVAACKIAYSPILADRVLASLKELRFALWQLITALERGQRAPLDTISVLNRWRCNLAFSQEIVFTGGRATLVFRRDVDPIDLPGLRVIAAATELLTDPPSGRLKTCHGTDCGWKFIDNSKNRSRRWCDMDVCGNLSKARRFRSKHDR